MRPRIGRLARVVLVLVAASWPASVGAQAPASLITGVLEVQWGDPLGGTTARTRYAVRPQNGLAMTVLPTPTAEASFARAAGIDLSGWAGRPVTVQGHTAAGVALAAPVFVADVVSPADDGRAPGLSPSPSLVSGSQPWLSILCKFADYTAEPRTFSYHQSIYGSNSPALDHYWRTVSHQTIDIAGSGVAGSGWFTLPHPRSYYVYDPGTGVQLDFSRAADDCTAVVDPVVNFSGYVGINLMFNADLDGYAWGGSHSVTVDGQTRWFRMTWEPPWGQEQAVLAHEMGHGFGLPHSSDTYDHTYGSGWDVMSGGT